MNENPESTYTGTAKILHWLMALLLFAMLGLGFYMSDLPLSPQKLQLYSWHKWAGVSAFLLLVIRLAWRLTHQPPELPIQTPKIQQWAAHLGHGALYVLMLVIPLSGWLMSSAKGFQTVWFGVLPIPDLLEKNKELGAVLAEVHELLNIILIVVLLIHIAAAIKHHVLDKDNTLHRMLPSKSSSTMQDELQSKSID